MRTHPNSRAPGVPDEARILSFTIDAGDEIMAGIGAYAADNSVERGFFEAIGGFDDYTVARYDVPTKKFVDLRIPPDQVEVLSLTGQVNLDAGEPVHVHAVLADRDGRAFGGHLMRGVAQPILLVTLTETVHEIEPHHV